MYLLALHIVSISALITITWITAHRHAVRVTEKRILRRLEEQHSTAPVR
ncbi:MAG: hypothetical protein OEW39_08020 [Deltaproteobacteria bacterium]|nr:hypothetical protein [Deltaproteobacteria bacterium]